jgi:hypothetical protein
MKKKLSIILILMLVFAPFISLAADTTYQAKVYHKQGGDEEVVASGGAITVESGGAINIESGGTFSFARERSFTLPLNTFSYAADASPVKVTTAGIPGLEIDDVLPNIVWADGETSPVLVTFRVPSDYSSGGAFRLICTESVSTTPNRVDFDAYVNRSGRAAASSASDQTPVVLAGTTSTPSVVTLTPATDFVSLAAGDWVTIRIWRDDDAAFGATGDLEVKGVEFFYTASN